MTLSSRDPSITIYLPEDPNGQKQFSFTCAFTIGRHPDCAIQLHDDVVSRKHAGFMVQEGQWWVEDLHSANGLYLNGKRINRAKMTGFGHLQLGSEGPVLGFMVERQRESEPVATPPPAEVSAARTEYGEPMVQPTSIAPPNLDHYKAHYFGKGEDQDAGEHTMMVRRAFAEVQKKQRRTYGIIIGVVVLLLVITGFVALYKHGQVVRQRKLATEVFYTLRTLEIDLMKLRIETQKSRSLEAKIQYDSVKTQKQKLEKSYEQYVESLGIYGKGLSEEEKIILRMARRFGECEINMPKGFAAEVSDFIENWQSSERLAKVIQKAKQQKYIPRIAAALSEQELPVQFFYLAVQESNLNHRAVGPPTRFGIAKGMWQFIPATAERYGLRTGPLRDAAVVDLLDERHNIVKSTMAAARYLRDIYTTDAQASGLLVMASYNWGENRVIDLIRTMPANPQDRNFWELMTKYRHKIPDETYDYVFSIFSAAVIGEDPRLFGFDFDNPLADAGLIN